MHNETVVWPLGQMRLLTERKGRKYGVLFHIVKQDLTPLLCRITCEKMNLVKIQAADINATHDERIEVSPNVRSDPSYLNLLISSLELDTLKETTPSKWMTVSVQWYIRPLIYQSLYEIPSSQSWITW